MVSQPSVSSHSLAQVYTSPSYQGEGSVGFFIQNPVSSTYIKLLFGPKTSLDNGFTHIASDSIFN
jgi:hypothetical protein